MTKRVAVIGSGASGLTAIKCCLDEGLEPVCFERTEEIGGLWNFTESVREEQACVMRSTVINTSKEMMCYSDFPIPKEFPVFMHNTYVQKYFHMYADHFNLKKCIRFNIEVNRISQAPDFSELGQWVLKITDKISGKTDELLFDAVLVCTGHHANKHMPTFPGLNKFKGKVIHSHDYKDSRGYEGKRIVIIGIGNSGGDAAVELSRVASQVFLSTRRGSWVLNRITDNGAPIDMAASNRVVTYITSKTPNLMNSYLAKLLNKRFDHKRYSLQPKHPPFAQHPMVNDDLPNRIICGSVQVRPNVKKFTETGVYFDDGTFEDNIDVVFLATGYIFGFPFLDKSVIDVKQNRVELYKYMFPPDLEKLTLAVVGCFQPLGAIMPISEMQCRLATKVFKGERTLPSRDEMWHDIRQKQKAMAARYVESQRHTIQVDYIPFMDELAVQLGCKPELCKLLFTDPKLALTCIFGPCTPYQYRICGPGTWKGAREAIMTQWDRTWYPLATRPLDLPTSQNQKSFFLFFIVAIVVLAIFLQSLAVFS
ncbi:hypothetical protein CHS0354_004721 [Potamilus streckersoni]|uniref:Flavin-containing monooxygenase n=1 Tax=Potamilus streckersoni TaxID=2493646 RepID=A0AAE0W4X0_9BIVA|nr:hypothetical protein CHS0354_004721 [Potamilus streckersoni]